MGSTGRRDATRIPYQEGITSGKLGVGAGVTLSLGVGFATGSSTGARVGLGVGEGDAVGVAMAADGEASGKADVEGPGLLALRTTDEIPAGSSGVQPNAMTSASKPMDNKGRR